MFLAFVTGGSDRPGAGPYTPRNHDAGAGRAAIAGGRETLGARPAADPLAVAVYATFMSKGGNYSSFFWGTR